MTLGGRSVVRVIILVGVRKFLVTVFGLAGMAERYFIAMVGKGDQTFLGDCFMVV